MREFDENQQEDKYSEENTYQQEEVYVDAQDVSSEEMEKNSGRYRYSSDSASHSNYNGFHNESKKKRGGTMKKVGKIILSAALFGIVAGGIMVGVLIAKDHFYPTSLSRIETTDATTEAKNNDTDKTTTSDETGTNVTTTDVSDVVEQVMPSVVSITSTVKNTSYFYGTQESQGAGSGFIIAKNNKKLYIATNNHVVSGASSLTVGFSDGTTATAQIVGTDTDADLAVISVDEKDVSTDTASKIKVAVLGDSDSMKVGEAVIAIGNALGYGQSVTTGVVSAKDREVSFTDGTMILLQTDAAINPGNSGGVLINHKGQVVGINNAKLEDTSVEGMGYAIPISTAKEILNDLMNATTIKEGDEAFLGVVGKNIDSTYSEALGMPSGIYVSQVVTGSPAEKAGISAGDIIVGIDGNNVSTMSGLKEKLSRKSSGTEVEISLKRANQNGSYEEMKIKVTLGKKSDFEDVEVEDNSQDQQSQDDQQGNSGNDNGNYIDPFEYFFGNGGRGGNGYYYYNR